MDKNLKYIEDNYIEFEELIKTGNITREKLGFLIENKLIPEPSYILSSEIVITSSLNDRHKISTEKKYFHPNVLQLIRINDGLTSEKFKTRFKENLLSNLKKHPYKAFAYGNVFNEDGTVNQQKTEEVLEEEWSYFCKGVYGICTVNNNEEAIINKEVTIKRILDFIEKKSNSEVKDDLLELKKLNDEFNKSTSLFAPYQRESSSRGKYLDKLLKEFLMEDLIK